VQVGCLASLHVLVIAPHSGQHATLFLARLAKIASCAIRFAPGLKSFLFPMARVYPEGVVYCKAMKKVLYEGFYSDEDVRHSIEVWSQLEGSKAALSRLLGVNDRYLSDVFAGRRTISEAFAAKLGYRRVIGWEREVTEAKGEVG
jgi:hypothetical protein